MEELTEHRVSIAEWNEVVGRVLGIDENYDLLTVRLNIGFLTFPGDSLEAKIVRVRLKNAVGDVVGVLRTDSASHPIAVRILGKNRGGRKSRFFEQIGRAWQTNSRHVGARTVDAPLADPGEPVWIKRELLEEPPRRKRKGEDQSHGW